MTCLFKHYRVAFLIFLNAVYFTILKIQLGFLFVCFFSSEIMVISQKLTLAGLWRGRCVTMLVTQPEKPCLAQDCPLSECLTTGGTFCISDVHVLVCKTP